MRIVVIIAVLLQLSVETCTREILRFDRDGDIYAAVGQPLNVFCIINKKYKGLINSGDLEMRLKIVSSGQEVRLNSTLVRIVNETAIELHYKNVTGVKTVDFEYGSFRSVLSCSSSKISADEKVVRFVSVGDLPHQPKITGYFVDNWKLVNFTWNYSAKQNSYNTTYAAWFRRNHTKYRACEKIHERSCVVAVGESEDLLIVKVNASNVVGKSSTDNELLQLNNRIRPGPVQNLTVLTNSSGNGAYISFSPPRAQKLLEYKIQLKCNGHDETFEVVSNASVEIRRVGDLPAYSFCNLSVGAATTSSYSKLWGPFSTYQFVTNENVPSSSPETCRACFELIPVNNVSSTINIFMKPLPVHLANGKITQYYVKNCMGPDKNVSTASELNKIVIEIPTAVNACHIEFRAGTRIGYNFLIAPSVVDVSTKLKPTQNSTVILSDSHVTLSWLRDSIAANYTVFWRKWDSGNEIYQNAVDWARVESGESHHVLPIPLSEAKNYRFGIGYETEDGHSNGIQWSECLYSEFGNAYAVDVKIVNVTANSVTIHLTVDCSSRYTNGYVYAYNIHTCDKATCSVKLVDSLQSERTVDYLRSDSEYRLFVQSLSSHGDDVQSETKIFRTAQDNSLNPLLVVLACVFLLLVVIVISMSMVIRWLKKKLDVYPPYIDSNQPITTDGSSYGSCYLQRENPLFSTEEDRDTAASIPDEQQLLVQFCMSRNLDESSSQRPCPAVSSDDFMNSAQSASYVGARCKTEHNNKFLGNEPSQLHRWSSAEDDVGTDCTTQQLLVSDSTTISVTSLPPADTSNVGELIPGGHHLLETPILGRNTEVQCTSDSHFVNPAKSAVGASPSTVHTASDSRQSSACSDDYAKASNRIGNDHHTHCGANSPVIAPTSSITATLEGRCSSLPHTPTPAVENDETARGIDVDSQQSVTSAASSASSDGYAHCVAREDSRQSRASTSNGNDDRVELLKLAEEKAVVASRPPNENLVASSDCDANVKSTSLAADGQSSPAAGIVSAGLIGAIDVGSGGAQTVAGDSSSSGDDYCCAEMEEAKQAFQQPEGEPAELHYDDGW